MQIASRPLFGMTVTSAWPWRCNSIGAVARPCDHPGHRTKRAVTAAGSVHRDRVDRQARGSAIGQDREPSIKPGSARHSASQYWRRRGAGAVAVGRPSGPEVALSSDAIHAAGRDQKCAIGPAVPPRPVAHRRSDGARRSRQGQPASRVGDTMPRIPLWSAPPIVADRATLRRHEIHSLQSMSSAYGRRLDYYVPRMTVEYRDRLLFR
jgi:hypothetical protein